MAIAKDYKWMEYIGMIEKAGAREKIWPDVGASDLGFLKVTHYVESQSKFDGRRARKHRSRRSHLRISVLDRRRGRNSPLLGHTLGM
jgi:hypothetical protein